MGRPVLNKVGKRFGRLLVVSFNSTYSRGAIWNCICDCGKEVAVSSRHLMDGGTNSCGCLRTEVLKAKSFVHGYAKAGGKKITEYYAWHSMKDRCLREKHPCYHRYGGRGITVCDRWVNSFQNFLDDMGFKPYKKATLDRVDNNKGYYKENCRWVDFSVQNNNRSNNVFISYKDKTLSKAQWARLLKIEPTNFQNQIKIKTLPEIISFYEKKRNCIIC